MSSGQHCSASSTVAKVIAFKISGNFAIRVGKGTIESGSIGPVSSRVFPRPCAFDCFKRLLSRFPTMLVSMQKQVREDEGGKEERHRSSATREF